ncbi:hypothetical protein FDP41_005166 [Naegleria fowleri]|uniref:ABC1 atypical kinase-like domain-containing protein n=1 Tax=Naegleria fowleri TaxID=5763 RepID=A0A6A5BSG7_NAEFO|nr:uncharacterized protein FDP41_005166 [Naegleria fowleri]KAF0975839.1 hypothetical protein FDP41_005166 [Naegleria fowleri]CAG4708924.1 unnamed protein product [Naegleria fowleri]
MLEDFLRVAQGVGLVLLASGKRSANSMKKATSPFTLYPQSPIQQFAHNIKTIQNAPNHHGVMNSSTLTSSATITSETPKFESTNSLSQTQFVNFNVEKQQEQTVSKTSNIYFDNYGNFASSSIDMKIVEEPQAQTQISDSNLQSSSEPKDHFKAINETPSSIATKQEQKLTNTTSTLSEKSTSEDYGSIMYEALMLGQADITERMKHKSDNTVATEQQQDIHTSEDEIKLHGIGSGLKEKKVPTNSISRAIQFAALGIKIGVNAAFSSKKQDQPESESSENIPKEANKEKPKLSVSDVLTEKNAEILADTLCKMRGAALKIGQVMSIQDESTVPPVIQKALEKVRHAANIMPQWQLEQAMSSQFGEEWKSGFKYFDMKPIAAASIGQVHRGILTNGREVAIKVQYPGVAESIDSDIRNVERLMKYTNLVPRGAFLDKTMEQARKELSMECDYIREAKCQKKFKKLIQEDALAEKQRNYVTDVPMSCFSVPDVVDEFTTRRVLCTELIKYGKTIDQIKDSPVEVRNKVAKLLLKLCLKELFEFKFMQTDPNWSNFFYDVKTDTMHLLDFGACMEFPQEFVDQYIRVVYASATKDVDTVIDASRKMGFLTGEESQEMNEAHAKAAIYIGEPFSTEGVYDFRSAAIPERVTKIIPTLLRHRLTAPPPVTYSLHRKLSGAFLLCNKLDVAIPCREIFLDVYERYMERRAKEMNSQTNKQ